MERAAEGGDGLIQMLIRIIGSRMGVVGLVTIALALAAYHAGPRLGLDDKIRTMVVLAIVAVGVIVLVVLGISKLAKKKRREKLASMQQPAEVDASQLARMRARAARRSELKSVVAAIKASQLVPAQAPWYLVLGAPGAGKSALIGNTGLRGSHDRPKSDGELGQARIGDWWFTDQGVFLEASRHLWDPAGSDSTETEWLAFVAELRRLRSPIALQGVMVVVSATELCDHDASGLDEHARTLRRRLDALTNGLQLLCPVYVMVSKMDTLAGYAESFHAMPEGAKRQVWGVTVDHRDGGSSGIVDDLTRELDALGDALTRRTMLQMVRIDDVDRRVRAFEFPQQFASLRDRLVRLMSIVAGPDMYGAAPLLRGIYFGSTTTSSELPQFLRTAIVDVIIPDFELARPKADIAEKRWRIQAVLRASALAAVLLLAVNWIGAFIHNREMLVKTRQSMEMVRANSVIHLCSYNDLKTAVTDFSRQNRSLSRALDGGLFRSWEGKRVVARDEYYNGVTTYLVEPCREQIGRILDDRNTSCTLYLQYFEFYKVLAGESLPLREDSKQAQALEAIAEKIVGQSVREACDDPARKLIANHFPTLYLQHFADWRRKRSGPIPIQYSDRWLECFQHGGQRDELYEEMLIKGAEAASIHFSASSDLKQGLLVAPVAGGTDAAFSKAGWSRGVKIYLENIESIIEGQPGLRETIGSASISDVRNILFDRYYSDYKQHWRELLKGMHFKSSTDLGSVAGNVARLADEKSDLVMLLEAAHDNLNIEDLATGDSAGIDPKRLLDDFGALHRLFASKSSDKDEKSARPLDDYLDKLMKFSENIGPAAPAADSDLKRYVARHCEENRGVEDAACTEALKTLLLLPAQSGSDAQQKARVDDLNGRWLEEVVLVFRKKIQGRYPFDRTGHIETAVGDFKEFFRPGGTLAQFEDKYLGAGSEPSPTIGSSAQVALTAARSIRSAFFGSGGSPRLDFHVKPQSISSPDPILSRNLSGSTFEIGEQPPVKWSNGSPFEESFFWDGGVVSAAVSVALGPENLDQVEIESSEWSIFRLLQRAKCERTDEKRICRFVWKFEHDGSIIEVPFMIRAATNDNPFAPNFFNLSFPERLTD